MKTFEIQEIYLHFVFSEKISKSEITLEFVKYSEVAHNE